MQTITLVIEANVVFENPLEPGTEQHLTEVLRNYLRGKGIELEADNVIRI